MKIATAEITTKSSREHDRYRMEIDQDHMRHIMDMMSDMYENPIKAVIREYATNALDSHRAAGVDKPIDIHLPTALAPNLKIKDQGLGLDLEGLTEVYRKYGASTKRDSNDQVGGFGIGAKSAFAVADQYTVVGIKDGIQTTALFTRNDEGDADMLVLGQKTVDAPNGVTVNIPIAENHPAYEREAKELFSHWDPALYNCVGVDIPYLYKDATIISEQLTLADRAPRRHMHHHGSIFLRTGEVIYDLSLSMRKHVTVDAGWSAVTNLHTVVINLPIGTVDLAPSREGLRESKRTIAAVQAALDGCMNDLKAHIQAKIDACVSEAEAIRYYIQNYALTQILTELNWKGLPLPICPDEAINLASYRRSYYSGSFNKIKFWTDSYRRGSMPHFVVVDADRDDLDQPPLSHVSQTPEEYTLDRGVLARVENDHYGRMVLAKLAGHEGNERIISYHLVFKHETKGDPVINALQCAEIEYNALKALLRRAKVPTGQKAKDLDLRYRVMIEPGTIVDRNVREMVEVGGRIVYQHGNNKPTTSVYERLPKGSQLVLIQSHRLAESFLSRLEQVEGVATPVEEVVKNIVNREVIALDQQSLRYLTGRILPNKVRDTLGDLLVRDSVGSTAYEKALRAAFPACPRGKSKELRSLALLAKQYDIKISAGRDENFFKDLFQEYPALNLAYIALEGGTSVNSKNHIITIAHHAIRKQDELKAKADGQ
jgi:hypothetical protein